VLRNPRFKEKEMARKRGLVSMVGVPLKLRGKRIIGVLNCFTAGPHASANKEINLMATVANQAAMVIFNTELMVKTKVIQEELETRKMVERAMEILMQRLGMKGDEAFRWIQKRSMNSRRALGHIAEAIIPAGDTPQAQEP
jgi:GAF domain-containing protein